MYLIRRLRIFVNYRTYWTCKIASSTDMAYMKRRTLAQEWASVLVGPNFSGEGRTWIYYLNCFIILRWVHVAHSAICLNFSWISAWSASNFCLIGSFPCDGDYVPISWVPVAKVLFLTSNFICESLNIKSPALSLILLKVMSPWETAFTAQSWNVTKFRSIALVL